MNFGTFHPVRSHSRRHWPKRTSPSRSQPLAAITTIIWSSEFKRKCCRSFQKASSINECILLGTNVHSRPKADNRLPGSLDPSESGPDQKPSFNDILQRMVH